MICAFGESDRDVPELGTQNIDLDKKSIEDPNSSPRKISVIDYIHDPEMVSLRKSFNDSRRSETIERYEKLELEQYKKNVFKLLRPELLRRIKD